MILLFLIIIIIFYFFLKKVYFNNLLFFLDVISNIVTYFYFLFCDTKFIEKNINDCIKLNDNKLKIIKFRAAKLFILNFLIALHQKHIINTNCLLKYYEKFDFPKELKYDLSNKRVIFAMAHYGIFYDFTSFSNLISPLSCIYKMKNKFIENLVYNSDNFKNIILPIKYDQLGSYFQNNYSSMFIPCDQKSLVNKKPIEFLNHQTQFHYSVADIHKITKRSIWAFFVKYDFDNKKMKIELVPIEREKTSKSKHQIIQEIANVFTERILNDPDQYMWTYERF